MKLDKSKLNEVAEEINECFIEAVFTSHWALVTAHHYIGKLIVESFDDVPAVLPSLSKKCGRSERTLYRAIKLYKTFPTLDSIPEGKSISMNKLNTKYLTEPGEAKEEKCYHCKIHCPR